MKHKVFFDDDAGAVRLKLVGKVSAQDATEIFLTVEDLYKDKDHRFVITDHSESPEVMARETRKVFQDEGAKANFEKHAIVGANPATRMGVKIIMAVLGQLKTTKFFKTDEEAVNWITEEEQ